MERSWKMLGMGMGLLLLAGGCGGDSGMQPNDDTFVGLDSALVREVLENPAAEGTLGDVPGKDAKESMAQAMVINFGVCRDAHRVYRDWVSTGIRPQLSALPEPGNPRDPGWSDWQVSYADLVARVDSGDPAELRFWLTALGSCGRWIPAVPNDTEGPTIAEVIEGQA